MKRECSVVRDLLPLYLEHMVRPETADYVAAHLGTCRDCRAAWDAMQPPAVIPAGNEADAAQNQAQVRAMAAIRKKLRRRTGLAVLAAVLCLALVLGLLHQFPVYRLAQIRDVSGYYTSQELAMLVSIGSPVERAAASSVLRLADAAFADCRHTDAENEAAYGLLARYAISADRGVVSVDYTLELCSAHLDGSKGYLWVWYSQVGYDAQGQAVTSSKNVYALWQVEKDAAGAWTVTGIREHP